MLVREKYSKFVIKSLEGNYSRTPYKCSYGNPIACNSIDTANRYKRHASSVAMNIGREMGEELRAIKQLIRD